MAGMEMGLVAMATSAAGHSCDGGRDGSGGGRHVARPLARAAVRAGAAGLATAASEAGGGAELAEEGTDSVAPVASPGVVAVLEAALMVTRAA